MTSSVMCRILMMSKIDIITEGTVRTMAHKEGATRVIERDRIIDSDTGEVTYERVKTQSASTEPYYVKLYFEAWAAFKGKGPLNSDLLVRLLPYMTYASEGQRVVLNPAVKKQIARDMGWSGKDSRSLLSRVNHELAKLGKTGVIRKIDRDIWEVNPEVIGRGDWKDIRELRATFNVIGENAGEVDVTTVTETEDE